MSIKRRLEKTDDIPVPDLSDDAAERKRVLNVLAQRRYRKKKRERLAALEAQAKSSTGSSTNSTQGDSLGQISEPSVREESSLATALARSSANENAQDDAQILDSSSPEALFQLHEDPFAFLPNDEQIIDPNTLSKSTIDELFPPGLTSGSSDCSNSSALQNDIDSFLGLTPNSPSGSSLPFPFSLPFNQPNNATTLPADLSSTLQTHQSSTFTFPDDHTLPIPPLTLLRAALTVATRLGIASSLWDFTSISPFYTGTTSPSPSQPTPSNLPSNLHPTPTQHLLPHHPLLDLLPWPTVRDKLIQIFNLPPHLRPASASDPMALVNFVYDMEDPAEGMRVEGGGDPFEAGDWEVGQVLFERWWWAFDGGVVERSNVLRRGRGERGLVLGVVG
ncbi:hypothetical protein FQN54_004062 [Arachnomyces sp. PD_36]|nr:hypothetical protein FQN54_004062 [Arachnomyces sp. PD_36]